jgi:5-methylcytosine-specific restriction enzyme B
LTEDGAVKLVQFHPSYTYEDFFEGFRPSPGGDGSLGVKPCWACGAVRPNQL